MTEIQNKPKQYDLEDRTFLFAGRCRSFVKKLPKTIGNREDGAQLIRSSGSIGANYIEANEALSSKDFVHRIMICRKEAKESRYWVRLVDTGENESSRNEHTILIQEATELMMIFSAIMRKSR